MMFLRVSMFLLLATTVMCSEENVKEEEKPDEVDVEPAKEGQPETSGEVNYYFWLILFVIKKINYQERGEIYHKGIGIGGFGGGGGWGKGIGHIPVGGGGCGCGGGCGGGVGGIGGFGP